MIQSTLLSLFFWSTTFFMGWSQDGYIRHQVKKGETVLQIAERYQVTPYDIYRVNPDARLGIASDAVLLIPRASGKFQTHEVQAQETWFGIAQKYSVSVADLQAANADAMQLGLQPGQKLVIPAAEPAKSEAAVQKTYDTLYHVVKPKETPFGVAQQYGLTVTELVKLNPKARDAFQVGDKVIVKINPKAVQVTPKTASPIAVNKCHDGALEAYTIEPKETLFSIGKKFNISKDKLLCINPDLKDGVKAGAQIWIPSEMAVIAKEDLQALKGNKRKSVKELVLMIPFNAHKIKGDSLFTIQNRLKKDAFLNMSLEYYSGALMAIDSAQKLGYTTTVRILDSEEDRTTSNVQSILKSLTWDEVDAVIGPFYPQYVEQVSSALSKEKIVVISPLRDVANPMPNLFQSMTSSDYMKEAVMSYLVSKDGNILAAVDDRRDRIKQFIKDGGAPVTFIAHKENGQIDAATLRANVKANKTNYVIVESHRTTYLLSAINAMHALLKEFDIRMVILEKNDVLDFDEISVRKLAQLQLIYPSITKDVDASTSLFHKEYRKKYQVYPSNFAVRGFDLVFDTLLRMHQSNALAESLAKVRSEQIESKFDYVKHKSGYVNKGIYILQYQDDLTIKLAN